MPRSRTTEKYWSDPEYRELQKKRAKVSYWRKRPIIQRPPVEIFLTEFYAMVAVTYPDDVRRGSVIRVPIYRIGQFAKLLGKDPQTIRLWIKDGRIPPPTFEIDEGARRGRGYTYDQMRAAWEFIPLLNLPDSRDIPPPKPDPNKYEKGRHDPDFKRAQLVWQAAMDEHRYDHNPFSRALKQAWERMPDGILVQYADDDDA